MSLSKPTPYGNAEDLAMINRSLVAQLRKEREEMAVAEEKLRALREPHENNKERSWLGAGNVDRCTWCYERWPCETVRVIDGL